MKRCYYEILEVDKKATASQIKTAYRKMALKFHPDKNPTEQGKKVFLQVQQAYDVLSDPNERTFYDNNREKILFNKDEMSKEDLEEYSFGFNIWEFFSVRCFKGFGDDEAAFYSVYRNVFEKIKGEQMKAYKTRDDLEEEMRKFEGFGTSTTVSQKVVQFYENWQNFTTYKTFAWCEGYDTRDAQNRWVKRRMQQQNTKERTKQRKNYIKTIKDLVSFVKKRDLRYQQYLIAQRQEEERQEKERQKKLQEKKKEKQQMKKVKAQLEEERFREIEQYHKKNNINEAKTHEQFYEEGEEPEFYCRICNKTFKSENQILNHEKSKAHKQNVKILQKQVMLPGEKLEQAMQDNNEPQNLPQPAKKKRLRKKNNQNASKNNNQNQQNNQESSEDQKKQILAKQSTENKNSKTNNNIKNKKPEKQQESSSEQEEMKPAKNKKNAKNKQEQKKQPQKKAQPKNEKKPQSKAQKKEEPKNTKTKKQSSDSSSQDQDDILNFLSQNRTTKPTVPKVNEAETKNQKKNDKKAQEAKGKAKKANKNQDSQSQEEQTPEQKTIGKAKLKKMKKAEEQKNSTGIKCKNCQLLFQTKNQLFKHLEETGHAAFKN